MPETKREEFTIAASGVIEMAKRKCKYCKEYFENWVTLPVGTFCTIDHAMLFAGEARKKQQAKQLAKQKADKNKEAKAIRKRNNDFKKSVRKRTGKGGYYESLKKAIHYYVKHVLRKGEPCYTCDLPQKFEDNPQAFHVGHFMPAKMVDPRRFMLENLRMQCQSCNTHNSGKHSEYRLRLIEEKGIDHVVWLENEVNHKSLKEQYVTNEDIVSETARYRKLAKS
tara:strand:- start:31528 stop:32199 length:672 start_codon:yes stop_codon:yes gene_type:complete